MSIVNVNLPRTTSFLIQELYLDFAQANTHNEREHRNDPRNGTFRTNNILILKKKNSNETDSRYLQDWDHRFNINRHQTIGHLSDI